MRYWTRPDGRCFVYGDVDDELPPGRIYATADETDTTRLAALTQRGFAVRRRELVLRLPTAGVAEPVPPPGIVLVPADRFDEQRLRLLDDLLRQDVPGTDGWRWSPEDFHEETYETPAFDPATYLVAVDERGDGVGIVRVWMRPGQPRLGFVGVRRDLRRRGVARALLAAVLAEVGRRGIDEVRTEVDETNVASRALLGGFGGKAVGAELELVRAGVRLRASTPDDAEALADLQVRSAQAGFTGIHPAEVLATLDRAARVPLWRERLPLVAEDDGGIVGLAELGPSDEEAVGEILRFFVAPERWGAGVGRTLMAGALAQLREAGFPEAVVWVHTLNPRARRFYEACGFRPDGAAKDQEALGRVVQLRCYRIRLP